MGGFFGLTLELASVFVRHMGWLDATPDKEKRPRREMYKGSPLETAEPDPIASYVVEMALDCGLCNYTSSGGVIPTPWTEIRAWQEATGNEGWWLAQAVRRLSKDFVSEFYKARDPVSQPPIDEMGEGSLRPNMVSQQFHAFLKAKS